MWAWDVIAWPGHLAVVGDIGGGFVFVRERDMFDFFNTERYGDHYGDGSPYLQADYWAGKLTHACSDAAWAYGSALILTQVRAHLEEAVLDGDISQDVADRLIVEAGRHADTEDTIREWLFTTSPFNEYDTWEWQYRSLSHHYLVACYAIVTAVRTYRAARTETPHPSVTDLVRTDRGGPVA